MLPPVLIPLFTEVNINMNQNYMKEKPILPLLLSMALPMVISMLVNSLYNIVDSFFVSKISEDAMTALSLVFPVQNFINAVAIGFGVGITALISLFLGAGDNKNADAAATHGVVLAAIHGVVITIASILMIKWFLGLFSDNPDVIQLGCTYSYIVFTFSIINMEALAGEKIFQAVGKMKVSMIALMCGCIVNIVLDPVLIFGLGFFPAMGIAGAALATGIGQTTSLIVYIIVYIVHPITVRIRKEHIKLTASITGKLYGIGIPAILNLALPSLLVSFLNAMLAGFSASYVVVLGIYYKLQTFLYLPASGLIQGMRPIIGFNYGARESVRVKKIYHTTLALTTLIMLIGTIGCLTFASSLIGIFTSNAESIEIGAHALRIICIGFIFSAVSVTASGALEGVGKGIQSFIISLLRYLVIIIPAAAILCRTGGPSYVWHAFWITEIVTAVVSHVIYKKSV